MYEKLLHNRWSRICVAVVGSFLSAVAFNLFIVPQNLYSSGLLGLCQLIYTLLSRAGFTATFNLTGLLYLLSNLPLIFLAWRNLGRRFVVLMIICVVSNSLFLSVVPVPSVPIVEDRLTCCMLGGILNGFACGLILTCGGSAGGLDTLGMVLSKKGFGTVGRFSLAYNAVLYVIFALMFSVQVALYSAIYSVFCSLFVDRLHQQNISVQVLIFTKEQGPALQHYIMEKLSRGVTYWGGTGAYTHQPLQVLCVCLNKYEIASLRQAVRDCDPTAFMIINEGVQTSGNFDRHLS